MQEPEFKPETPKARSRRAKDFRRHELLLPPALYDRLRSEAERRCLPLNVLIRLALEAREEAA